MVRYFLVGLYHSQLTCRLNPAHGQPASKQEPFKHACYCGRFRQNRPPRTIRYATLDRSVRVGQSRHPIAGPCLLVLPWFVPSCMAAAAIRPMRAAAAKYGADDLLQAAANMNANAKFLTHKFHPIRCPATSMQPHSILRSPRIRAAANATVKPASSHSPTTTPTNNATPLSNDAATTASQTNSTMLSVFVQFDGIKL